MAKKRKAAAKKRANAAGKAGTPRAKPPIPKSRAVSRGIAERGASQGNARHKAATFEEAQSAVVDALIRTIEEAERQLSQAKRARSFDELPKPGRGPAA